MYLFVIPKNEESIVEILRCALNDKSCALNDKKNRMSLFVIPKNEESIVEILRTL